MLMHLGVDSTDSLTEGMCTTFVGLVLVEKLLKRGYTFVDYPHLIRLNPNIPYKTRGNGAICLRIDAPCNEVESVFTTARETVEDLAVFSDPQTNPGIALYTGHVPDALHAFYKKALHRLLMVEDAIDAAEKVGARLYGYKNKRGVIGALASIGEPLLQDHTYELLTYREKRNWGKKRIIDKETVIAMDKRVRDVFFNYDYEEDTICIAPHTVCPVLVGIRGETAESVKKAVSLIDVGEPVFKYVIFRTNQHTSFHFERVSSVSEIVDYSSVIVEGEVVAPPEPIEGGHVFFEIENRGRIHCAAFEPTKKFRDRVRALTGGDRIRAYGGVKPPESEREVRCLNLERLDILELKTHRYANPACPRCGKSMTSKGRGKGFACKKCKTWKQEKERIRIKRALSPGVYEPPPSAWRHLYRMTSRTNRNCGEKITLIDGWIMSDHV
jgi:tRNA(Ile2)-agmatinylcytidine synthase